MVADPGIGSTRANEAPRFTSPATKSVPENTTAVLTVTAMDDDDSIQRYDIVGGADASKFSLNSSTGALAFRTAPNYEAPQAAGGGNNYMVVVRATSGTGNRLKTVDQTITVTVTDVTEKPGTPNAPSVSMASETSLMVRWSAPTNTGPPINDYDYRYRTNSPQGTWTEVTIRRSPDYRRQSPISPQTPRTTSRSERIARRERASGRRRERVRRVRRKPTRPPRFTSSADKERAREHDVSADGSEQWTTTVRITSSATRSRVERTGGSSRLVSSTDVLTFKTAPNFEDPQDVGSNNNYVVVVRATSGTGTRERTADQTITVTVTDETNEKPSTPNAPSVSAASETSLNVNWWAPDNEGPPITDYDYRYKKTR